MKPKQIYLAVEAAIQTGERIEPVHTPDIGTWRGETITVAYRNAGLAWRHNRDSDNMMAWRTVQQVPGYSPSATFRSDFRRLLHERLCWDAGQTPQGGKYLDLDVAPLRVAEVERKAVAA